MIFQGLLGAMGCVELNGYFSDMLLVIRKQNQLDSFWNWWSVSLENRVGLVFELQNFQFELSPTLPQYMEENSSYLSRRMNFGVAGC